MIHVEHLRSMDVFRKMGPDEIHKLHDRWIIAPFDKVVHRLLKSEETRDAIEVIHERIIVAVFAMLSKKRYSKFEC
jgi:hypothetical protein